MMHIWLIKYRVLYIIITIFFLYVGYDAWDWFKGNQKELTEAGAAGFVSIYLAVIGALKYVLENAQKDDKHD